MKHTKLLMGMPITIEVVDRSVTDFDIEQIFNYFASVDTKFSTYRIDSEISQIKAGNISKSSYSPEMKEIFLKAAITTTETNGYFDIHGPRGIDPSGIVKGWAIHNAANLLLKKGFTNFFVDAGGDIQVSGRNTEGKKWVVGIRNPFNRKEIIKVLSLSTEGIATSGTAIRGQHVYNPHRKNQEITDVLSITVIASNVYDADRFATAAFAMGRKGIYFLENLENVEGYLIDKNGMGMYTSGFDSYVLQN